jgi:hypothetical protein
MLKYFRVSLKQSSAGEGKNLLKEESAIIRKIFLAINLSGWGRRMQL